MNTNELASLALLIADLNAQVRGLQSENAALRERLIPPATGENNSMVGVGKPDEQT